MPSMDENIEAQVVTDINTAIGSTVAYGRKIPTVREGEDTPRITVACAYDREEPGENTDPYRRNVFYSLLIVFYTRSNLGSTGDETLNAWRQIVTKLLYGPTLAGVPEVDDIRFMRLPASAIPPLPDGIDTQGLMFEVETYESIT